MPGTALILLACTAAVLVTVALSAVFVWRARVDAVEQARAVAGNVSLLVAEHAARLVESTAVVTGQAAALAGPPDAPLPADAQTARQLAVLAGPVSHIAAIELRDAEGRTLLSSRVHPVPPAQGAAVPVADLPELALVPGRVANQPAVVMKRTLPGPAGAPRGSIVVGLNPDQLRHVLRGLEVGYGHTITLRAADGSVLIRDPEGTGTGGNPPLPTDIAVQRRVDGNGLTAEVVIATSSILKHWRDELWTYVAFALAAVATVLAVGALAIQRARRERQAEDALQHAYDTLEEHVRTRTTELESANARLENALTDKEVLLKEVQHRVKNNLQVICSLLRLQAARIDDKARRGFDESLRRIQTLSLLHELIYRSDQPGRINIADFFRQLCDGLARSENPTGARLVVEAEDWTVDVDQATPLALIASELVSNALLHAFPSGHPGTVTVGLGPIGGGPIGGGQIDGGMRLTIRDDGVGLPPDMPPRPASAAAATGWASSWCRPWPIRPAARCPSTAAAVPPSP
ncbi:sensor histidine kinase [Azospirillum thermophilum]|uniref:sensor histidine kinase n=1 Tax=Azospirillum thermophilum TaxID=2202148 RepID=UPI001FEB8CA9|nr:histidine kinase dimerization/phosphoacceptor domain -containing protein [Azospirillum thermophilum]